MTECVNDDIDEKGVSIEMTAVRGADTIYGQLYTDIYGRLTPSVG